jgi:glycosyltransferase involved in cell wall biosynthesis
MSRVAVVTSSPPFAEGGHLVIARSLVTALRQCGHDADLVLTPQNRFGRQAAAYLATWLTDVGVNHEGEPTDQAISFRYPSYAVRHRRHVCWLNHRMREYYDLWERFSSTLSRRGRLKERARRRLIHVADRYLLTRNVHKLFAQSRTIQARLQRFGDIRSEVLYPPAPPRPYRCDEYGGEFLAVSRLTPLKRMDLVVRALAEPEAAGLRCAIAGDGEEAPRIQALIREHRLEGRVRLNGAVGGDDLVHALAHCRAVCFPPIDEDFGLVTVEAFASRKPVITCKDSGGPAELVQDAVEGFVCDPTPSSMARAMRRLADDEALAVRMGNAAFDAGSRFTWEATVKRLLSVQS